MGLLSKLRMWLAGRPEVVQSEIVVPPPPIDPSAPTLEVFAQPGHGRTSFLWALLYMLRKLNLVWPDYLCWPQDDETEDALKAIHESVREGRLPRAVSEGDERRYALRLDHMERWGEKRLVLWDWPDPVFSSGVNGARSAGINWQAPAWWLLSLPDLKHVQAEYLDMLFDDLARSRARQGHSLYPRPFRLVVVLTKGDAISDLPLPLREYLREDPIWKMAGAEASLLSPSPAAPAAPPVPLGTEPLQHYLGTLWRAHETLQQWFENTLAGHMMIRRAAEYHVDLRFSIVSATGSGICENGSLQLPWSPRRVLDPLFWALELDSAPAR